jgi:hypothetical protein
MIWTLNQRCWQKNYRCYCLLVSIMSKNYNGWKLGINLRFYVKHRSSRSKAFVIPYLINGYIKPHFGIRFSTCFKLCFLFALSQVYNYEWKLDLALISILFMHFEVEAQKLLKFVVNDLHVSIDWAVKVISFIVYIKKWRQELWETIFYKKFKVKGGNETSVLQVWVFHILLSYIVYIYFLWECLTFC